MELDKIYNTDALSGLDLLPDNSVDMCVTSPPYYALRDYGMENQLGLESHPDLYINKLVDIFIKVQRVLKPEGTLWININDTYCGTGDKGKHKDPKYAEGRNAQSVAANRKLQGYKPKDMIGIPWMLAFKLREHGFYLRQDIIWNKPNAMPSSVKDRCVSSYEHIFLLSKSAHYYFDYDAIKEKAVGGSTGKASSFKRTNSKRGASICPNSPTPTHREDRPDVSYSGDLRSRRDVWSVPTKPYAGGHYATYPEELIRPCILAGCPAGGVVLDPFMGVATTALVAKQENRHYVGFELNPDYIKEGMERLNASVK